jgi:hypothetical protein
MSVRPPVIRDQDKIDVRLTGEAEYLIPFTFIEALNEGTLFDRPAHAFLDAARERRLFHVLNRTTDNIIGTGIIQGSGDERSTKQAEVGGLMFHPAARGFGLCSLLVKIMMVYAVKESGRDSPGEEYLAHVIDGNGAPLHALLEAGFSPIGPVDVHRGDIDAVIDYMIKGGESVVHRRALSLIARRLEIWSRLFGSSSTRITASSLDLTQPATFEWQSISPRLFRPPTSTFSVV